MQYFDPNDVENFVEIKYSNRIVTFKFDATYITSRLIDGEFPSYDKALQNDFLTDIELNKIEFRNAVDIVALTARESDYKTVKFDVMHGRMEISASSPDIGEARKTIEAQVRGDTMEIAFNVEYVLEVLRVMDSPRVHVQLGGKYEPALFCEHDNPNYSYVVTPVRL